MPEPNHINLGDTVFLCPCRSGNTTMKMCVWETLYGVPTDSMAKSRPHDWHIHATQDRFDYIELKNIDPVKQLVVGLIRDPYQRALSMWGFSLTKLSFEQWLGKLGKDLKANQHVRTQASDLMLDGKPLPHLMIYLEYFEEDWEALCRLKGWKGARPPTYRNSLEERDALRRDPEVRGPDDRAMQMLFSHYAADFALYDLLKPKRAGLLMKENP